MVQHPCRVINVAFLPSKPVPVFNNASDGHSRKGEDLRLDLQTPVLKKRLVKNTAIKLDNASVRMNGAGLEPAHRGLGLQRNLHIRVAFASVIQDLDAMINKFSAAGIIPVIIVVKLHRGSARIEGHGLDLQVLAGNGQPLILLRK